MNYLDYLTDPEPINNPHLAQKLNDTFRGSTFFGGKYPQLVATFVNQPTIFKAGKHLVVTFNFNAITHNPKQAKRVATNTFRYQIEARQTRSGNYTIVHKHLTQISPFDTTELKYHTQSKRMMNDNLAHIFTQCD